MEGRGPRERIAGRGGPAAVCPAPKRRGNGARRTDGEGAHASAASRKDRVRGAARRASLALGWNRPDEDSDCEPLPWVNLFASGTDKTEEHETRRPALRTRAQSSNSCGSGRPGLDRDGGAGRSSDLYGGRLGPGPGYAAAGDAGRGRDPAVD